MVQSKSSFYRAHEELATSPLYIDRTTREVADFFLDKSTKGLSWKTRLERTRSKLDAIQGEEAETALKSHIEIMKGLLNESSYLKRNATARAEVSDYIAERENKYHALKGEKEVTQIASLLETKVIVADTSTKSQTIYSTDISAKQPLYFIPQQDKATQTAPARPGVKYSHVRSPITADKVPFSPRPQIPFGSIPAHIQEQRIRTASQLASMYAENSLPSTSLRARLARGIRRNPIKSAIAAGIIGLAGLGAWVAHEYNLYKQPVIAQSTTTPTRINPIVADSPTTREHISQNVDMELPSGFNLASMTSSKGPSQAKLPEKQVARTDQVKSVKSTTNQKSLEHQLSEWFSQASEKATIFANRLDKATKRIAQEYELMREEPQRHFNMEKTLAHGLRIDTAAPQLSDESFTVRVGPAEDEAEMPARVKRGIPSNYWPVESPLKSGIGAPLIVYYNAGNSKHISPETQTVESSPNPKPLSNEWFEKIKAKHKLAGKN